MAFEGVPSKTKVDQYPLNPIGTVQAWHRPSGPLRVFPACLWCRARAVGGPWHIPIEVPSRIRANLGGLGVSNWADSWGFCTAFGCNLKKCKNLGKFGLKLPESFGWSPPQ